MKSYKKIHGIVILDKPVGISSNLALQKVRRLFGAEKAGHGGSLDVLASGLLPIFFGSATKFSQYALEADKIYRTVAKLGIKTTTSDAEGEVVFSKPVPDFSLEFIETVLEKFRGHINQTPSMYSALKHQGRPLYELARQGVEVDRESRSIHIRRLELVSKTDDELTLEVECSKGTYIRNLVEDIGEALGCGAHVSFLRRLQSGVFIESQMRSLEILEALPKKEEAILSPAVILAHYPLLNIDAITLEKLRHGQVVNTQFDFPTGYYRLYSDENDFLGLGVLENRELRVVRLLAGPPPSGG